MPSIAIIGASQDRKKFGNKAVRAYLSEGWTVYPVNPREKEIEGLPVYATIGEVPDPLDSVSLYVLPAVGLQMLPAIAERQPHEVWLNPGTESDELIELAADLHQRVVVACSIVALGLSPASFP